MVFIWTERCCPGRSPERQGAPWQSVEEASFKLLRSDSSLWLSLPGGCGFRKNDPLLWILHRTICFGNTTWTHSLTVPLHVQQDLSSCPLCSSCSINHAEGHYSSVVFPNKVLDEIPKFSHICSFSQCMWMKETPDAKVPTRFLPVSTGTYIQKLPKGWELTVHNSRISTQLWCFWSKLQKLPLLQEPLKLGSSTVITDNISVSWGWKQTRAIGRNLVP